MPVHIIVKDARSCPSCKQTKDWKSNFRLRSEITSTESTLQLVYDVLRLTPFYKTFLVTTHVPEIYMQEFWATTTVHHHSIRVKMDNRKRIVNLKYFREMLHIYVRFPGDELPFEEEILAFLRFFGHNGEIRKLTNVNINKLHHHGDHSQLLSTSASVGKTSYIKLSIRMPGRATRCTIPCSQSVMLLVELTNKDIKNSKAYKEYYAVASGAAPPKTKASVRKTKNSQDTTITPPTATGIRLLTFVKGKQPAKASKAKGLTVLSEVAMTKVEQMKLATKRSLQQPHISQASSSDADEGTGVILGVPDIPTKESDEEILWKSSDKDNDDDDDDDVDERNDDQDTDKKGDEFVHLKLSIHEEEETKDEESFDPIVQTPENSDDEETTTSIWMEEIVHRCHLNLLQACSTQGPAARIDSLFETTPWVDVQSSTTVASLTLSAPTLPTLTSSQTLEANFSEFVENNQFAGAISSIPEIVQRYMDEQMNETVKEQVNEQVKVKVSKILSKIEKTVNEQLEAEVLTRSSNSSKISYAVAADLSEMELNKILINKMKSNKSIHRSDEQRNLYKDLVEAYESDKIILDTYKDTVTLKRCQSTSAPKEKATKTTRKSTHGSKSNQKTASESAPAEEPMHITQDLEEPSHQEFKTGVVDDQPIAEASQQPKCFQQKKKPSTPDRAWNKTLPATHRSIQPWINNLAKQADSRSSFNELMDTPVDFSAFLMNRLKVDTLTLKLLAGQTYELMKGSCKSFVELEFFLE
uniref:Retrovirus-related Pol polyprotein from transposon TNT 1-94 n=1 Tax=Tanacetum cinerariifolium TaxID=118510 RepID=A0A699H703_TANCI|nr:hypothetical protein [Tanacetum cinerariifolium]